jgi:putative transposase
MNVDLVDQTAFDAVDTCVRHIASVIALGDLKGRIWRKFSDEDELHYAHACLAHPGLPGVVIKGGTPSVKAVKLSQERSQVVAHYPHRIIRKALDNTWPRLHLASSMALDEMLYRSFVVEHVEATPRKRQYVSVIGPRSGERVVLPLAGVSRVSGNIRLALDRDRKRAFVHVAYEMRPLAGPACGPDKALDWSITEVCTDSAGIKYGKSYGQLLSKATEQRNKTGKARGKPWALTRKSAGSKRAKHIAKHTLGTSMQSRRHKRTEASLQSISGAAPRK